MKSLESALIAICRFLKQQNIPYMVIGGMANAVWGEPRATLAGITPYFLSKGLENVY